MTKALVRLGCDRCDTWAEVTAGSTAGHHCLGIVAADDWRQLVERRKAPSHGVTVRVRKTQTLR
jgi:hypothetical protein